MREVSLHTNQALHILVHTYISMYVCMCVCTYIYMRYTCSTHIWYLVCTLHSTVQGCGGKLYNLQESAL